MSSPLVSRAIPQTQITIAAASIAATYSVIGSFSLPIEWLYITSTLDEAVTISFDGVNDFLTVPAGDTVPVFIAIDFKTNRMVMPATSVSVKEVVSPTTGSLFVSALSAVVP